MHIFLKALSLMQVEKKVPVKWYKEKTVKLFSVASRVSLFVVLVFSINKAKIKNSNSGPM